MSSFHPFKGKVSKHFGDRLSPEDAYLSYYDTRLTREDIDSIKDDWLTDNAIQFWCEYLEQEKLKKEFPEANIILLRPVMTYLLMFENDIRALKTALPDLSKTTHVFLPVNDKHSVDQAGGTHWSLLLVSIIDGVAFHYDSLASCNKIDAMSATRKLEQLIRKPLRFMEMEDSPQQDNGSDCGVFVCILMKHLLLKRLLLTDARGKISMTMGDRQLNAWQGRKEMLKTIESFRKEGERRRS
ncbi:hypothetical protein BDY21DRAFT_345981 [Lineolata rhizophorae]|uniref:Ubiquitin-like protease family profile domain-containing protein n=1 Tax=Lineolata rhizophorae TaxID=578093 RepID=A0A6A6NZ35_9PEZI|nr:hypothetical protein BDY21DRAFT_345981 [Lineolata rhizophorae]